MELIKNEKIGTNQHELHIKLDRETFDAACSRAYVRERSKINVPGFRRGKAPRAIIEKMYGKGIFYEDALNELIPDNYDAAVKEAGIEIVGQPEFDVVSIDDDGVVIKAVTYVTPDVKIEGYRGIEATKTTFTVTDEEVDHEIDHVREHNARELDITDRPAETGDTANINYEGFCDGNAFDGGKGEGVDLKLGSGSFIPGFEEQVAGHSVGDEFDVNVIFPTEYHAKELAGKEAVFKCKINSIKHEELPEADDEFAKDVSDFDTFAEYREDMKKKIGERKEKAADAEVEEQIIDYLVSHVEADVPAPMIDAEAENIVRDYDMRLRSQGLDLSTYMKYTGQTLDKLREQVRPQAERQVKTRLALSEIAKLENIEVTDEQTDAEFARLADVYSMEVEKVKEAIAREDIAADLRLKAAVDLVKSAAKVTEKAPEAPEASEKAPAKKPAVKKTTRKKAPKEPAPEAAAEEAPATDSAAE